MQACAVGCASDILFVIFSLQHASEKDRTARKEKVQHKDSHPVRSQRAIFRALCGYVHAWTPTKAHTQTGKYNDILKQVYPFHALVWLSSFLAEV